MKFLRIWLGLLFFVSPVFAGEFSIIHQFDGVTSTMPYGSVILSNGVLYGTTVGVSSSSGGGTVYKLNTDGSDFEVLHSFTSSTDGIEVYNGLTLVDGNIYGIARNGGSAGCGVLFKIDSSSAFSVIHNFTGSGEGSYPYTAPTYYNGSLYGLTWGGWASGTSNIYQYNLSTGTYTSLYNMTSPGVQPFGTVTVINGYLYGMNSDNRDTANHGNIFKYNLDSGSYEIVHTFAGGTSGGYPYDSLVWDGGTYVYGTTMGYAVWSEDNEESTPKRSEELADEGVVFRLNIETNEYTVLHDFSAQTGDGAKPNSSMLIAPDGWLYGIAHGNEIWGGTEYGTLYRMRLDGSDFEVLHVFDSMEDGNVPMRSIIWDDGIIYGTTAYGGYGTGDGYGTVWMFNTLVPEPATLLILLVAAAISKRKRRQPPMRI